MFKRRAEDRQAHVAEVAHALYDAGIPLHEGAVINLLVTRHLAAPPDEATVDGWVTETRRALHDAQFFGALRDVRFSSIAPTFRAENRSSRDRTDRMRGDAFTRCTATAAEQQRG